MNVMITVGEVCITRVLSFMVWSCYGINHGFGISTIVGLDILIK